MITKLNVQAFFQDTAPILQRLDDLTNAEADLSSIRPVVEEIIKRAMIPERFKHEITEVFVAALDEHIFGNGTMADWLMKN